MALPKLDAATTEFFNKHAPHEELAFCVAIYRTGRKVELFDADGGNAEELTVPIDKVVTLIDLDSITVAHTTNAVQTCWTDITGKRRWWWI